MEHWQFLIQKQGDRSWHPLEPPNVEIIEGRYRVVARSNRANIDVEVRVTHSSTLEVPPKRRIYKRSRCTNSEGLMAVIPFTYLKPGVWELQCSGDLMSDILGKSWQHNVYLQVFAQEIGEVGVPTKWGNGAVRSESRKEDAIIDQPVNPVWLKGETAEQILQNLIELALPASEPLLEDETKFETLTASSTPPLVLTLDEETVVARWGQTLTINGRVEQKQTTFERVYGGELRIELRSPLGLEILTQVRQSLPQKLLPSTIRCKIEIPEWCESKLILAEISLYGALASGREAILLANQSFTIIADVTELLAITATANKSEPDIVDDSSALLAPPATSTPKPSAPLNLELFNLVKTPKTARSAILHASPKKSLPPRIQERSLHKSAAYPSVQLPKLPQHQNKMISPAAVSEPLTLDSSENNETITVVSQDPKKSLPPRIDLRALRIASVGTTLPYLRRIKVPTGREEVKSNTLEMLELQPPQKSQHPGAIELHNEGDAKSQDDSFNEHAVKLEADDVQSQDESSELIVRHSPEVITTSSPYSSPLIRKWMQSQGYSLSEPINLQYQDYETYIVPSQQPMSEEQTHFPLNAPSPTVDVTPLYSEVDTTQEDTQPQGKGEFSRTPQLPPPHYAKTSSSWLAQEIVVDDISSEAEADTFNSRPSEQKEKSGSNSSNFLPIYTGITEPLPIPQLHLPDGELISGESVRVRVQLAKRYPQVAVKLWVEDCQTRWLLDGPRLLTLLPNALGGLEEMTQINVPFGCLEIRLEAIAIDMVTQHESHKVTIQRTVIPPDLPSLQLNVLDL